MIPYLFSVQWLSDYGPALPEPNFYLPSHRTSSYMTARTPSDSAAPLQIPEWHFEKNDPLLTATVITSIPVSTVVGHVEVQVVSQTCRKHEWARTGSPRERHVCFDSVTTQFC
jgi:hypothetical protein